MRIPICLFAALSFGIAALAASTPDTGADDAENFRLEITGSAWLLDSSGTLHSQGTIIDIVSDLGFDQQQATFSGKLVFKQGRKHRIIVEGTPFRDNGLNTVQRTLTYHGQTFTIDQTLQSHVDLNVIFAGYQYDVISKPAGHLGFSVGGAYIDGTGTLLAVQTAERSSNSQTIGLPLAGAEFRVFPLPGHRWLDIDGGLRGMGFGDYGHYLEGDINGGIWPFRHLGLQAGYRTIDTELQDKSDPVTGSGVKVTLHGPIFSLVFKW